MPKAAGQLSYSVGASPMPLEPGDRLGPYTIQALLGMGGMGEVYRGHDSRLGRDIALKVISASLVGDARTRARFEVEARAASALNHPSIVTIFDVGETAGVSWIAMEWVEGRTLRHVLDDGAMALKESVAIARQIAEGLAVAHGKGIVHRDLKPENIMLAADGRAKILDFGLARQSVAPVADDSHSTVDTIATPPLVGTFQGSILGTVGYMSPEQAAGRPLDFRSDQFACGLVLYEMLAGRKAFERPSAVETLTAIIREDPVPLSAIRPGIPEPLLRVIGRCLAKRPEDRFASTRDLVAALETSATGSMDVPLPARVVTITTPASAARSHRRVSRASLRIGIPLAIVLTVAAMAWSRFNAAAAPITSLAVLPFENAADDPEAEYLGSGLTESLITQMSRVPSLTVMAHSTTAHQYERSKDARTAGQALGVGAVLAGKVTQRKDRVSISAELIETATGARLWGQTYERSAADLLQIQDSIATEIADGLRLRLSGGEKRTLSGIGTTNAAAYELFLRARYLMTADTEEDDVEAGQLFQKALDRDPGFLDARLGLSGIYARRAGNGYAPPRENWMRAREEAQKALALDPTSVQARAVLATVQFMFDWDWHGAEQEFWQLRDEPRLAQGNEYQPLAIFFWARGLPGESVGVMERALRLDPANLESRVMLGDLLAQAGRLDDALNQYRSIIASDPSDARAYFGAAEVLRQRGEVAGAVAMLRKGYELGDEDEAGRAVSSARSEEDYDAAQRAVARMRLVRLTQLTKDRYVSPLEIARLHAMAGDHDDVFAWLERALIDRSPGIVLLKVDRAWDSVRSDPRFARLVTNVGAP
jgi:serine/threonine protein kinase/tetratricopeptide (TPR) repeat protein